MKINIHIQNPTCHDISDGRILIRDICMDHQELIDYANYCIEWSNNISEANIKYREARNLTPGKYSYRIAAKLKTSQWFDVELQAPDPLTITAIATGHNCENHTSYVDLCVSGGTPPYMAHYGSKFIISEGNQITFKNIDYKISDKIKIKDKNNCYIESDQIISTDNSFCTINLKSIIPPNIYDDHPSECLLEIIGTAYPYILRIKESDQDNYSLITQSPNITQNNIHTYDLSSFVYPGTYKLQVTDAHNCTKFLDIDIPNKTPITAQVAYQHNKIIERNIVSSTETIINTILIPYHLLINNPNLTTWLQNQDNNQEIDIIVGKKTYKQKIKHNYLSSLLVLGQSSNDWYYPIIIRKGFDPQENQHIFLDSIKVIIGDAEYNSVCEFGAHIDCFQLIRSNLLTKTIHTNNFIQQNSLKLYQKFNEEYAYLTNISYIFAENFSNVYKYGNFLHINILDNQQYRYNINIDDPKLPLLSDIDLVNINNLKYALSILNDWNKEIYISPDIASKNNGSISVLLNIDAIINYQIYDVSTQKISNIYLNNERANSPNLLNLDAGIYIIKITNKSGDIVKIINNEPYDNHYEAAKCFIERNLCIDINTINFQYGDILIHLCNYSEIAPDAFMLGSNPIVEQPKIISMANNTKTQETQEIYVNTNNAYNNSLYIITPHNIEYTIVGPNDISYTFSQNIKLINLPVGVYNITGNQDMLKDKFYSGQNYEIFVDKNQHLFIHPKIVSYYNQPLTR